MDGKLIELDLTGIAHGGEALARHEGKFIFVSGGIPGERVAVEIVREKGRWARACLLEVLRPSPDRISPPCPYFGHAPGRCGGCQWQHISYPRQLELKREVVRDQLARLAKLPDVPVHPTRPVGELSGYLNTVQLTPDAEGRLGFYENEGDRVVSVASCLLMHPLLAGMFQELQVSLPELSRLHLRAGIETGQQIVILETKDDMPPQVEVDLPVSCLFINREGRTLTLIGDEAVHERVEGRTFRIGGRNPFPPNTVGAAALVQVVSSYLSPEPHHTLVDAYCGVGLFGLSLAGRVGQVVGVEADPSSCEDFRANATGLDNVALVEGEVGDVLEEVPGPIHLAVATPPSVEMGKGEVEALAALGPRVLVVVASDPAALARDAALLAAAGYRLEEVQPVDLFPQTRHVESVARFQRGILV